jgi:hypothetical protein
MLKSWIPATAAALLVIMPNVAHAKVPVLNLGDLCGFMAVVIDHSHVSGFSNFDCQTGNFVGMIGTVAGARAIIASIHVKNAPKHSQFLLQVSYPLVNGGAWSMYYTRSGYTMKPYTSGTYTVIK